MSPTHARAHCAIVPNNSLYSLQIHLSHGTANPGLTWATFTWDFVCLTSYIIPHVRVWNNMYTPCKHFKQSSLQAAQVEGSLCHSCCSSHEHIYLCSTVTVYIYYTRTYVYIYIYDLMYDHDYGYT